MRVGLVLLDLVVKVRVANGVLVEVAPVVPPPSEVEALVLQLLQQLKEGKLELLA